jgi:hypothetical protein
MFRLAGVKHIRLITHALHTYDAFYTYKTYHTYCLLPKAVIIMRTILIKSRMDDCSCSLRQVLIDLPKAEKPIEKIL